MPAPSFDRMTPLRSDQPSVGAVLRHQREALEWHIEDVAQWLRIRARILVALEEDDFASLPGEAYAVGFVRAYAQAMQLDATDLVSRFQREYRRVSGGRAELVFPQAQGEKGLPVGLLIGAGFILVAAAYAGWYHFSSHDEPIAKQVPSLAALMPNNTSHSVMTSPQVASVMPGKAPTEEKASSLGAAAPSPEAVPVAPPSPANSPISDNEKAVPMVQSPPEQENTAPQESISPESAAPEKLTSDQGATDPQVQAEPSDTVPDGQIAAYALAPVWVQIADHTGHVLVSRVLQKGETWGGDAANGPYRVSVGNAGGVVFMAHNVVSAPLGQNGAVRRNVMVTLDAVQQGAFGHGALPVSQASGTSGSGVLSSAPVLQSRLPASHEEHSLPIVKRAPQKEQQHDDTTDELNARQLTGQSPTGDSTSGH